MRLRFRTRLAAPIVDERFRAIVEHLHESEERYRALFDANPVPVLLWDMETRRIVDANEAAVANYGYEREELLTCSILDLRLPADVPRMLRAVKRHPEGIIDFGRTRHMRKDGSVLEVEVSSRTLTIGGRRVRMVIALDVTEKIRALEEVERRATHDALTGLLDRAAFMDGAQKALACASAKDRQFALIFVDLDGFKHVNDTHGHLTGDALLQAMARRLRGAVRDSDTVGRLGGDEFVVLLERTDESALRRVTSTIVERLGEPYNLDDANLTVTASAGVSRYPRDGTTLPELLRCADRALYRAKGDGKNTYVFA